MPDLADGESCEMKGSGARPYVLKNSGGVYSCSCPAWRNQSIAIERRSCKHLRKLRGDEAETARVGTVLPQRPTRSTSDVEEGNAGPPLLLAHSWDNAADLAGWWMSEKLDGVRAYWDGRQFLSRLGNLFHAPEWFLQGLPETVLDGELWIDRKAFQRTVGIVRRQDKSELWRQVRFVVFDAPAAVGGFEDRLAFVRDTLATHRPEFAAPLEQQLCRSIDHLREELARVEALGGEGLMLREPGSKYEAGRSMTLLKVKTFHDAEATVIGHEPGAGRHKGRLGALRVKLPSGVEFSVGTGFSDAQRGAPPAVGASITFRFQELSDAGVPRFPSYVGVRHDVGDRPSNPMDRKSKENPTLPTKEVSMATSKSTKKSAGVDAVATSAQSTVAGDRPRYFEFVEGKSSKFWEIARSGSEFTTRWGRIGTTGQSKTKTFADEATAIQQTDKIIADKIAEGYVEK